MKFFPAAIGFVVIGTGMGPVLHIKMREKQ